MSSMICFKDMSSDSMLKIAVKTFQDRFKRDPDTAAFGPGRVNLIGEHTDYNDGYVFPLALPYRTIVVGALSNLPLTRVYSCNITSPDENEAAFTINDSLCKGKPRWANYVKGTIFQYLPDLPKNLAFDAVVISNVPIGSGLSSSASLEVAMATFLEKLCGIIHVSGVEKALRCQKAEHTFADTPCGIMDQFISSMGKKGSLLLIDCRYRTYKLVDLTPPNATGDLPVILITNSNVKHSLSGSEYPERVAQCKEAVAEIKRKYPDVTALRDVSPAMLAAVQEFLPALTYQRAGHSVSEDNRTMETIQAIENQDYVKVGELMTASHASLRDKYNVSCKELDILVDLALEVPGVYGSRMTGGGFGGCTVTLVKKSCVDRLKVHLKRNYKLKAGLDCECYEAVPSEGSGTLDVSPYLHDQELAANKSLFSWFVPITVGALSVSVLLYIVLTNNRLNTKIRK